MASKGKQTFGKTFSGVLIPEGWETRYISSLADIYLGGTPKTSEKDYWNGNIKWVTAKDISHAVSRYIENTERTISQKGIENSSAKLLPADSIIITARGVGVGDMAMLSEPMAFNQTCYGLKAKAIDGLFLFYKLKSVVDQIRMVSYGTVFTTITMRSFDEIEVSFPTERKEQKAIASILASLDSKIELNQQINETLEAIGQSLFKHWFIDYEFPNEEGKPYKSSGMEMVYSDELEKEIPKMWKVKAIDKIANYLNGLALQKYPPEGKEYLPIIKIREMRQGITKNTDKASLNIPQEYIVNDGDIIFSWSGSLDICIWGEGKGALNQHLFKVTSGEYPKWFYYYWIKHYLPHFRHIAAGKATTMGHIKRIHLSETFVPIPPDKIIEKLDSVIAPLLIKYVENCIESRNLELIRNALLPRLLSGKIRVKVPEG